MDDAPVSSSPDHSQIGEGCSLLGKEELEKLSDVLGEVVRRFSGWVESESKTGEKTR